MSTSWHPDLLGPGFEQTTVTVPITWGSPAAPAVATVVRALPAPWDGHVGPFRHLDVLYVHGWSDYFFQRDLARFWTSRGARFYAVDLHGYGRSLLPGQTPGYVTSLRHYDADIQAALDIIGDDGPRHRELVLMGHSTGGLILTLWAARHPGQAAALILNSPWLELQLGALGREVLTPLVGTRALIAPRGQHPVVDLGFYTRAQREIGTLPDSPPGWRPERGFPTHPGWLAAVMEGHREIHDGIDVQAPVLVLLSARSSPPLVWSGGLTRSDSVLVVDEIAHRALRIAHTVTISWIDDAIHDVFLSRDEPRQRAYDALSGWVVTAESRADRPRG